MTGQLHTVYRDWQKTRQPGHGRPLIKPPGRYSQCERFQRDSLHRDNYAIFRDRAFGTFAFARHLTRRTCKSKRAKLLRYFLFISIFVRQQKQNEYDIV